MKCNFLSFPKMLFGNWGHVVITTGVKILTGRMYDRGSRCSYLLVECMIGEVVVVTYW